jgi:hypothetical protein
MSFRTTATGATMKNASTSSSTGRGNLPIDQKAIGVALGAIQKRISSTKANANNSNSI